MEARGYPTTGWRRSSPTFKRESPARSAPSLSARTPVAAQIPPHLVPAPVKVSETLPFFEVVPQKIDMRRYAIAAAMQLAPRAFVRANPWLQVGSIALETISWYLNRSSTKPAQPFFPVGTFTQRCYSGGAIVNWGQHNLTCLGVRFTATPALDASTNPGPANTWNGSIAPTGFPGLYRHEVRKVVKPINVGNTVAAVTTYFPTPLPAAQLDPFSEPNAWRHPALDEAGYHVPRGAAEPYIEPDQFASNPGRTYVQIATAGGGAGKVYNGPNDGSNPLGRPRPATASDRPRKPPEGTKERKWKAQLQSGTQKAAGRIFGLATEGLDLVEALFESIPLKDRLKAGVTKRLPRRVHKPFYTEEGVKYQKFVNVGGFNQALYVAGNLDKVRMWKALPAFMGGQASDQVVGGYNSKAAGVTKQMPGVSTFKLNIGPVKF